MTKKTISAGLWSIMALLSQQGFRLLSNLIMTRMLAPEAFGVMALVFSLITGINMFSDMGIRESLVRSQRDDKDFINSLWTMQVLRAVLIFCLVWVMSWPFAQMYDTPELFWILGVCGLIPLFEGFNSIRALLEQRALRLRTLTLLTIFCSVSSLLGMLLLSIWYQGVWMLVFGGVLSTALMTIFTYLVLPHWEHRFRLDPETLRECIHFGKWIFLSSALAFICSQFDRMLLGKYLGFSELGLYSIAMVWAMLPAMLITKIVQSVYYPAVIQATPDKYLALSMLFKRLLLILGVLICILVAGNVDLVIRLLHRDIYHDAGLIAVFLVSLSWFSVLERLYTFLLLKHGKPGAKIPSQIIAALIILFSFPWVVRNFGMVGSAVLMSASMALRAIFLAVILKFRLNALPDVRSDIFCSLLVLCGGALLFYINNSLLQYMDILPVLIINLAISVPLFLGIGYYMNMRLSYV